MKKKKSKVILKIAKVILETIRTSKDMVVRPTSSLGVSEGKYSTVCNFVTVPRVSPEVVLCAFYLALTRANVHNETSEDKDVHVGVDFTPLRGLPDPHRENVALCIHLQPRISLTGHQELFITFGCFTAPTGIKLQRAEE